MTDLKKAREFWIYPNMNENSHAFAASVYDRWSGTGTCIHTREVLTPDPRDEEIERLEAQLLSTQLAYESMCRMRGHWEVDKLKFQSSLALTVEALKKAKIELEAMNEHYGEDDEWKSLESIDDALKRLEEMGK